MFGRIMQDDLLLRSLVEADTDALWQAVDANRLHLREWLPWLDATAAPEHVRQFIEAALQQEADNLGPTCAVVLCGRIAGIVGYKPIRWANRSVAIGYWLSRDTVGKGIMTRCCRVLVEHAFEAYDLDRVTIAAASDNRRSRAIPERLGFVQGSVIRDAEWLYDHHVDHVLYSVLKQDWKAEPAGAGAA
jgi:ribosomal-protein-serine acetyltransferase